MKAEVHTTPVSFYMHGRRVYAYAENGRFTHYRMEGVSGDIGQFKAFLLGLPSKWSQYLFRAVTALLAVSFVAPVLARKYAKLRKVKSKGPRIHLSLYHRCLSALLAYVMLIGPAGFEELARGAVLYTDLGPENWARANTVVEYGRWTGQTRGDGDFVPGYDANGSVTEKITWDLSTGQKIEEVVYEYNLQNRLSRVSITTDNEATWDTTEYTYNDAGIRVKSVYGRYVNDNLNQSSVETTIYLVDPDNHTGYAQVLEEMVYDYTGALTSRKTYTIGDDVITEAQWLSTTQQTTVRHLLCDGQGSVRHHADDSGNLIAYDYQDASQQSQTCDTFSYDAYGRRVDPLADTVNRGLFYTGEQWDSAAGQYYLRARYYDPLTGRFNRLDPFAGSIQAPQSLHKYLYCHANPVNALDPGGEVTLTEMTAVVGIMLFLLAGVHAICHTAKHRVKQQIEDSERTEAITFLGPRLERQMNRDWLGANDPEVLNYNMEFWHEKAGLNKAVTLYNMNTERNLLLSIDTAYHGLEIAGAGLGLAGGIAKTPIFWSKAHGGPQHWRAIEKFAIEQAGKGKAKAIYTHHGLSTITKKQVTARLLPDVAEVMPSGRIRITQFLFSETDASAAEKMNDFIKAMGPLLEKYDRVPVR